MNNYPRPSFTGSHIPSLVQDELWLSEQCREAIGDLERAMSAPPLQLTRDASAATRLIVHMRDRVIDWLRNDPSEPEAERWKRALERLNMALSLTVGIEFPTSGVRRKVVEQARDTLRSILEEGLL